MCKGPACDKERGDMSPVGRKGGEEGTQERGRGWTLEKSASFIIVRKQEASMEQVKIGDKRHFSTVSRFVHSPLCVAIGLCQWHNVPKA